jgi:hypothetical protein
LEGNTSVNFGRRHHCKVFLSLQETPLLKMNAVYYGHATASACTIFNNNILVATADGVYIYGPPNA